jgi:hypothetical protein
MTKQDIVTKVLHVDFAGYRELRSLGITGFAYGGIDDVGNHVYSFECRSAMYPRGISPTDEQFIVELFTEKGLWFEFHKNFLGSAYRNEYPGMSWEYALEM